MIPIAKISRASKGHLISEILKEAGLINEAQIEIALHDQAFYREIQYKIGEILVLHGWISQETAHFFARYLRRELTINKNKHLGDYLLEAGLLNGEQLFDMVRENRSICLNDKLFAQKLLAKGLVKEKTLDFFLKKIIDQKNTTTGIQWIG
ncbi:MAG: hypothetical protein VKJ86_11760 [Synechococcus sp.]|nr:hypothetical protein [Synechococcus sp.]